MDRNRVMWVDSKEADSLDSQESSMKRVIFTPQPIVKMREFRTSAADSSDRRGDSRL